MYQKSILISIFLKNKPEINIPLEYFEDIKLSPELTSIYFSEMLSKKFPSFGFISNLKKNYISVSIYHFDIEEPIVFKVMRGFCELIRKNNEVNEIHLNIINYKLKTNPTFIGKIDSSVVSSFLLISFNCFH
jgi:hypothetical protein